MDAGAPAVDLDSDLEQAHRPGRDLLHRVGVDQAVRATGDGAGAKNSDGEPVTVGRHQAHLLVSELDEHAPEYGELLPYRTSASSVRSTIVVTGLEDHFAYEEANLLPAVGATPPER